MEKKQYIAPKVSVTIIEGMTIMAGSLDPGKAHGDLGIGGKPRQMAGPLQNTTTYGPMMKSNNHQIKL